MKELLAFDGGWIGIDYDEDEAEVEGTSLEDVVEEAFGEEAVPLFAEAYELLSEDCVAFAGELSRPACLYVGTVNELGEYPVLSLSFDDGVPAIGGFVPFDVWVAQELGALERGKASPTFRPGTEGSCRSSPTRTATGASCSRRKRARRRKTKRMATTRGEGWRP
jgi:hypothetical protein